MVLLVKLVLQWYPSFADKKNDNTFYIHYNAEIEIDLDSLEEFRAALDYSIDEVVGQVGFKKDGRILEHSLLFDGWNDEIVCLF